MTQIDTFKIEKYSFGHNFAVNNCKDSYKSTHTVRQI